MRVKTKMEQYIETACSEAINCTAALEIIPHLSDTLPFPTFVLCEASAQSTGTLKQFLLDTVVGLSHTVLHKELHVSLGPVQIARPVLVRGHCRAFDALIEIVGDTVTLFPSRKTPAAIQHNSGSGEQDACL